jgi:hypothetical protein
MSEKRVEELVRSAVAQALERQLAEVRESVVQEVLREIGPSLADGGNNGTSSSAGLQKAVAAIQAGGTQKEILRALLDNTVLYSGRAALFVVKGGSASGWQGIGFGDSDSIKDFPLDLNATLVAKTLQSRSAQGGAASDFDHAFLTKFRKPSGKVVVLPLLLKDKVSALIYADGEGSTLDASALDVLVRATSTWLEVVSQRKQAHKEGGSEPTEVAHTSAAPSDPFAAHAPLHAPAAQHVPAAAPAAAMSAAAASGGPSTTKAQSPEEAELHRKAQRFARLLMDEIKLYNQAKVSEGRKNRDLYDRLKEDIEKSRATYQKRYGNTSAAGADYFNQELIRSLAEDDISLMGSNFRR